MSRILINGLGCPFSGSKYILSEFLNAFPAAETAHVHLPLVDKKDASLPRPNLTASYFTFGLWNLYLRLVYEIWCTLKFYAGRYRLYVNFSNYGLVPTRRQVLYLHNQLIVDVHAKKGFGGGSPNVLTRLLLDTTLRISGKVVVQTDHMAHLLRTYCAVKNVPLPRIKVLKPMPSFPVEAGAASVLPERSYRFQLFYPSTDFPHKNTELAMAAAAAVMDHCPGLGLEITCAPSAIPHPNVTCLGQIGRGEVLLRLRQCEAMLFTSRHETLGLPLLEALYYRKPAVMPDLPYAREIYGDAGVYFQKFTAECVSAAVTTLYTDYERIQKKVAERSATEFSHRLSWTEQWNEILAW